MVWVVVVAVVALSLVALAVALLKAYRAGKALASEVGRASTSLEPLSGLSVGPAPAPGPTLSETELRVREADLLRREAELERRLRSAPS